MHLIHKLSVKSISHVERGTNAGLNVTIQTFPHNIYKIPIISLPYRHYLENNVPNLKKSLIIEHLLNYCKSTFLAEVNCHLGF